MGKFMDVFPSKIYDAIPVKLINLRVNEPMPEEMFNNLLAISFSYLATNPARNHEFG